MLTAALVVGLLAQSPAEADTVPASVVADAYLDEGARGMIARARGRVEEESRRIQGYRVTGRQRVTVALNAFGRERLAYRTEVAARVEWERGKDARVTALGAREVAPMGLRRPRPLGDDDLTQQLRGLAFEPDRGWVLGAGNATPGAGLGFVHPLQPGSEEHYRFASGDTTSIRLPDGRRVDLLEVQVSPRTTSPRLLRGSLWLEAESHAPVRGVFRVTIPDGIGASGPNVQFGIDMEYRALVIEYAQWHGRWWLPRLMALEGSGTLGSITAPLRMEMSYEGYEIFDTPAGPEGRRDPPLLAEAGSGVEYEVVADSSAACREGKGNEPERCRRFALRIPRDRGVLVEDEHLPGSPFEEGPALVSRGELREAVQALYRSELRSGFLQGPRLSVRPLDPKLVRYNRVEGATLGSSADVRMGSLRLDGAAWWAFAGGEPGARLGLSRMRFAATDRLTAYHQVSAFTPADRPLELGNTLSALVLGSDVGDYYRATGLALESASDGLAARAWSWRLFAERQRPVEGETEFNLARAVGWSRDFRPNPAADTADQVGAEASLSFSRGLDPAALRTSLRLDLLAEAGDYRFVRPGASLFTGFPLAGPLLAGVELGAGTSFGEVPLQRLWYLGGPSTLRGVGPRARRGGEAHWRARGEVGAGGPPVRVVGFGEAGWVGGRGDLSLDPNLAALGVGASVLDGILRFDLSRTVRGAGGWQLQLYLGGGI